MKTIEAYGYEVTGPEEIIEEIEEELKTRTDGLQINWHNFENGERFWDNNGFIGYPVIIDHIHKRVCLFR